jgi:hypothetical protein
MPRKRSSLVCWCDRALSNLSMLCIACAWLSILNELHLDNHVTSFPCVRMNFFRYHEVTILFFSYLRLENVLELSVHQLIFNLIFGHREPPPLIRNQSMKTFTMWIDFALTSYHVCGSQHGY